MRRPSRKLPPRHTSQVLPLVPTHPRHQPLPNLHKHNRLRANRSLQQPRRLRRDGRSRDGPNAHHWPSRRPASESRCRSHGPDNGFVRRKQYSRCTDPALETTSSKSQPPIQSAARGKGRPRSTHRHIPLRRASRNPIQHRLLSPHITHQLPRPMGHSAPIHSPLPSLHHQRRRDPPRRRQRQTFIHPRHRPLVPRMDI